jgi:hypothetical protein
MNDMYIAEVFDYSAAKVSSPLNYGLITDKTFDRSSDILIYGGEGLDGFYVYLSDLFIVFSEGLI